MTVEQLIALINEHAPRLTIQGVDSRRLMWAIAKRETSSGRMADRTRFEPSYSGNWHRSFYKEGRSMYDRSQIVKAAWRAWGDRAACSYGVFQIMYTTALDTGLLGLPDPPEKLLDPNINFSVFIKLVQRILAHYDFSVGTIKTLRDIADAYNSGNYRDQIVPEGYIDAVLEEYNNAAELFR